eukprot:56259_1
MSLIEKLVVDNNGVDCGTGNQNNDICKIDCNNSGNDLRGAPIHCGDAGHCSIHCSIKRCMRESIVNATLSNSLYFNATALECLKDAFIYFPTNGNVTFIVDTLGVNGAHAIAKLVELHGESSDTIDILCKDPLKSEASKDDCTGMKIYAQGAHFLSVTVSGAEFQSSAEINCPLNSGFEPSCVVNGTNAHQMTDNVVINIGNGSMPQDLLWYGGTGDYGSGGTSLKVKCSEGISTINQTSKTFENAGPCWRIPTAAPTTTDPTTTPSVSPTTASPTAQPTTAPTINTAAPTSTASPTVSTSQPTASPTDATSNPTTSPITTQPSLTPSASTNPPTTQQPTTPQPTTAEPTVTPITSTLSPSTSSTVLREQAIEESTTYAYETSFFMDSDGNTGNKGMNSDTMYLIIGVSAGAFVCLLLVVIAFLIGRRSRSTFDKDDRKDSFDDWNDNRLAGAGDNQMFKSKSAATANDPNKASTHVDMVPRQKAGTYSAPPIPALPAPPAPIQSMPAPYVNTLNAVNSSSFTGYNNSMPTNYGAPATFPTNMQYGYNPMMTAQYSGTLSAYPQGETNDDPIEIEVQPPGPMMPPVIGVMMEPMRPQSEVVDTLTQIIKQHKQRQSLDQQPDIELNEFNELEQDEEDPDEDEESEAEDDDDDDDEESYDAFTPLPQNAHDDKYAE